MGLHLWRDNSRPELRKSRELYLDHDPQGEEEEGAFFRQPVDSPVDIDVEERKQDMGERLIYADRAFIMTFIWVIFLMVLPITQLAVRCAGKDGLSDPQFITVITTTTASVFGFWALVGRYLFEPKGGAKSSTTKPRKADQ
jgi:hypothetical protein